MITAVLPSLLVTCQMVQQCSWNSTAGDLLRKSQISTFFLQEGRVTNNNNSSPTPQRHLANHLRVCTVISYSVNTFCSLRTKCMCTLLCRFLSGPPSYTTRNPLPTIFWTNSCSGIISTKIKGNWSNKHFHFPAVLAQLFRFCGFRCIYNSVTHFAAHTTAWHILSTSLSYYGKYRSWIIICCGHFNGSATQPPFCNFKLGGNGDCLYDLYPGQ